jgi:BirA family biotin operon repressor/biotin-[acetyl-CoA-carboxylase] ligase
MQLGQRILRYYTVTSTNDIAWQHREHGLVVIADEQTAGRGQRGNRWHAPTGSSLMLSMLMHHDADLTGKVPLTIWAALGICRFIQEFTGLVPMLKWPNDVLVKGKKVCGVLVEKRKDWSVVGVGFNLNVPPAAFKTENLIHAGSLHQFTNQTIERNAVLHRLLEMWNESWNDWSQGQMSSLMDQWKQAAQLVGQQTHVTLSTETLDGKVAEMNLEGIQLETEQGTRSIPWETITRIRLPNQVIPAGPPPE